ncbi:hypothetical protein [Chryseobacterium daeguense]|uniref:hypothetical protein n=1 Tax=Chryseobacterium daeguense TaxID=412438 RepID=UPI0003FA481F|nr:hypothetical protein [Chryseobacterium daeguense]
MANFKKIEGVYYNIDQIVSISEGKIERLGYSRVTIKFSNGDVIVINMKTVEELLADINK